MVSIKCCFLKYGTALDLELVSSWVTQLPANPAAVTGYILHAMQAGNSRHTSTARSCLQPCGATRSNQEPLTPLNAGSVLITYT